MPPKQPDPPVPEEDESAALSDLAQLAAALGQAASDSEEESKVADEIFSRINRLSVDAQKRLFTRPEVRRIFDAAGERDAPAARHDDPPGTIYYRMIGGEKTPWSKKPWTWADLRGTPTATWVPERRMTLGFCGLLVTVFPRRPVTLPAIFHGIYLGSLRDEELAEEHAAWLFKKRDTLSDPSIITAAGLEARERANHDGKGNVFSPGGGWAGIDHSTPGDMDAERPAARRAG